MALYFGYKKNVADTEDLEKSISALKTGLATNNTKTQSLESSLFKKDGTVQMTGDLDLGDNSIVGIHDINANNSVVSKKYVDDGLGGKLSAVGGTYVLQKPTFAGGLSVGGERIQNVDTPTHNQDATNKFYVDGKIDPLTGRVTALEQIAKHYTYHFTYFGLGTSWSYPRSGTADGNPHFWMFCKNMTSRSRFHVHTLAYDTDASLDNNYTFTFKLDFFKTDGTHMSKEIFTAKKGDHLVSGERILFIDKKFQPSTLILTAGLSILDLPKLVLARLAVKGSSDKGNEFTISCSFEI